MARRSPKRFPITSGLQIACAFHRGPLRPVLTFRKDPRKAKNKRVGRTIHDSGLLANNKSPFLVTNRVDGCELTGML